MTAAERSGAWFVLPRPNPEAQLRLFCLPFAGGAAQAFQSWPEDLPPELEICPIQLPGRGARLSERPFTRMSPLIQAMAPALQPLLDRPFALFGHSLGALIAFELARFLRAEHQLRARHLFVSGRRAPHTGLGRQPIHDSPEPVFLEQLRRLNGTPERVLREPELMQLLLPMLRADFAVSETYVYREDDPLECPISAFGGREDVLVELADLRAWRAQTRNAFKLQMFPGDHFYLNHARPKLLAAISQDLEPHLQPASTGGGA